MNELFNFYLSNWQCKNQREQQVFVPGDVVRVLKPYHYDPIRFLYTCYKNKLGGAILNQSDGMNFPVQIAAFLNALKLVQHEGEILVLADNTTLGQWYYHLTEHSKWDVKLDIGYSEKPSITLLCHSEEDKLKMLHNHNFSMVVIDDFDKVAKKATTRKLTGRFKVGLTHRNFVKFPDQRLQWTMLRWSNLKHFGTFESFCEMDNECFKTFTEPFVQFWQRRTWIFYDDLEKETKEELQEYTEKVQKWLSERNFSCPLVEKSVQKKKEAPKRKSTAKKSKKTKCKVIKKDVPCNTSELESRNVSTNVKNEIECESADIETHEANNDECEEKFCGKSENTIIGEKTTAERSHNSDDILSFLFEDNGSTLNQEVSTKKSLADSSSSYEKLLSSLLFEDNSENCKADVNTKRDLPETSSCYYSHEKILSELFD